VVPTGGGRDVEARGVLLRQRDEVLHRGDAELRLHREHVGRGRKLGDRGEILEGIVGQRLVEAGIDSIGAGREQQGVAVAVGARHSAHADVAAAAALVLDHH
jgi:hypothetical protein